MMNICDEFDCNEEYAAKHGAVCGSNFTKEPCLFLGEHKCLNLNEGSFMDKREEDKHPSKYDQYTFDQRKADLKNVLDIQVANAKYDEYMRGMANGLMLAWTIMAEPYGTDVKYLNPVRYNTNSGMVIDE